MAAWRASGGGVFEVGGTGGAPAGCGVGQPLGEESPGNGDLGSLGLNSAVSVGEIARFAGILGSSCSADL